MGTVGGGRPAVVTGSSCQYCLRNEAPSSGCLFSSSDHSGNKRMLL